jgi:hypothetical protein
VAVDALVVSEANALIDRDEADFGRVLDERVRAAVRGLD